MRFWLLKSEAKDFSWQDLLASPLQMTDWSGVRNFTARKHLGMMKQGDLAFFYHSGVRNPEIVGIVEVMCEAYPDEEKWLKVDIKAKETFKNPVPWSVFRDFPESLVLRKQPRLSVVPIEATLWPKILRLANGESI
jgi:predicted RNA-binding protein with PUA-like domain